MRSSLEATADMEFGRLSGWTSKHCMTSSARRSGISGRSSERGIAFSMRASSREPTRELDLVPMAVGIVLPVRTQYIMAPKL